MNGKESLFTSPTYGMQLSKTMEVDSETRSMQVPSNIAVLLDDNLSADWMKAIVAVKNDVIGSNREKLLTVQHGLVPRLLRWVEDESVNVDLRTEAAIVLGSLSKGNEDIIKSLVDEKTVSTLLRSMTNPNLRYTEAILRCLRFIFLNNTNAVECLYEENRFGSTYIPHLMKLVSCSVTCQECITTILEKGCLTRKHQMYLLDSDVLSIFAQLLTSQYYKVQMPTLKCFANMCYKNPIVCAAIVAEGNLVRVFVRLMGRDKPSEMQIAAAKVLTYLHRGGAISGMDYIISRKTLGTLVRMCKRDRPLDENVKGAETLAFLVEVDPDLQVIASVTDHLISTLANYLHYKDVKKVSSCDKKEVDWGSEMKRAAFLAFASVSANDEEIRDKVIKKEGMVEQILASMNSSNEAEVAASLRCLQSLTRSVQQIRTVLHDTAVWKPLIQMLQSSNKEIMVLAMTCLCNLVLEFSPSKESLIKNNAVEMLTELSCSPENHIRLNAVWAIMSLSYWSTESLRIRIVNTMGTEVIRRLLEDSCYLIRQKALAVVRNIVTALHDSEDRDRSQVERRPGDRQVIDRMVKLLGSDVIDIVFRNIKNQLLPAYVLEQALCTLANISDGPSCKDHIIGRTEDLQAVMKYLEKDGYPSQKTVRIMLSAVQFIINLVEPTEDGAHQRMLVLKGLGAQRILEDLKGNCPRELDSSVKTALQHFR